MLAHQLGLGDFKTVNRLMLDSPKPEWVTSAGSPSGNQKLLWPVPEGKLWRGFNQARRGAKHRRKHDGIDIGAPDGTLFRAVENGLVAYSDNGVRGYGNLLVVIHPNASVTFYAHTKALYLFPGQTVKRGQVLGEVGHTGIARGSHLHFEYRVRGRPRDPIKLFDQVILPNYRHAGTIAR
ncbi:MAG: M23 family metallopeptidase [Deltaproteobacteria bacterium]|nr:M23 family metallopeptidase [Deltaproteobacteria bacterium]